MPRKLEAYIQELLNSIDEIKTFVRGFDFEQYRNDPKTKAAVERKFLNIGEALNQANDLNNEIEWLVTDFRKIVGLRNILAHGYFGIDDALVWNVVLTKLEPLKKDVEALNKLKRNQTPMHEWRACPYGEHLVRTHELRIPPSYTHPDGSTTTRHTHCAHNPSGKDQLYSYEIQEISKRHFSNVKTKPCPLSLGFKNGATYDDLIAGWTQYWNEVLKPQEPLSPNIVKALIASESAFNPDMLFSKKDSNSARGLMQITNEARKLLGGDGSELTDHFVTATKRELNNPSVNICAGIRWLFRKQEIASKTRLKRNASWEEAAEEYKGDLKGILEGNAKSKKDVKPFYKFLQQVEKCEK